MKKPCRRIEALFFGITLLCIVFIGGCKAHRQSITQTPPVVLENITEKQDTMKESHSETDIFRETTKEQSKESTTEKIIIVVNNEGDTLRTDREKTTIIDNWLKIENIRLQAKIDSLILNQNLKEKIEIPVPYPVQVEVEREFTAWEKFRLKAFWWLAGGLTLSIGFSCRKVIANLLSKLLTI